VSTHPDESEEILILIEKLKSPVGIIRDGARKELIGEKREKAINLLLKILAEDKDEFKRESAVESFVLLPDERGNKAIIELLSSDPSTAVREKACGALGHLKDSNAIEPLIKALHDPEKKVIFKAVWSLGEFKDERAIMPFKALLERTEDPELKRQLKLSFSRAFPDIDLIFAKTAEEKKKLLSSNVSKLKGFITNWKVLVVLILLFSLPFLLKILLETRIFSFTKPQLTSQAYKEKMDSIIGKKNLYIKDFKTSLYRIYVKQASAINQGDNIELLNYGKKFTLLKRELEDFIPPDEYKEVHDKIKSAIDIYSETCDYSGGIYMKIKVEQSLNYDELIKDIDNRIKKADTIISDAMRIIKKAK